MPSSTLFRQQTLTQGMIMSLKFVRCRSFPAPIEFFNLSSFCRSMSSFPRVLRYQKMENFPKNLRQITKPPRPTKGGTGMKLKVLKEKDCQPHLSLLRVPTEQSWGERGNADEDVESLGTSKSADVPHKKGIHRSCQSFHKKFVRKSVIRIVSSQCCNVTFFLLAVSNLFASLHMLIGKSNGTWH
jgi:hypothetical protein